MLMRIVWARGALSPARANSPGRVDKNGVAFAQLRDTDIRGRRLGVSRVRCVPVGMAHVRVPVHLLPPGPACLLKVTVPIFPFEHVSPLPQTHGATRPKRVEVDNKGAKKPTFLFAQSARHQRHVGALSCKRKKTVSPGHESIN